MGDDLGLEQRLNRLAQQGWELIPPGDGPCYLARMQRTERTELCYEVETAPLLRSENELKEAVERRQADGWEPVGTINGLDVYQSMPCRFAENQTWEKPSREVRRSGSVISIILAVFAIVLCRCWPLGGTVWYLTDIGAFLRISGAVTVPGAGLWILWRLFRLIHPAKKAAPAGMVLVRGGIAALFRLWLLLTIASLVLTLVPVVWAAGILTVCILLRILAGLERDGAEGPLRFQRKIPALWRLSCVGLALLAAMGLNRLGITNTDHRYSAGSASWRYDLPVIHGEELTEEPGEVLSAEYEKKSSLLVQRSVYSETTETLQLECQRYVCRLPGLTGYLLRELEERRSPEDSCYAVAVSGNQIMTLWCSEEWNGDVLQLMQQKMES